MKITWMGTNALLVEAAGKRILFDPFVELRGADNPNTIDDFMEEEIIFITHGHFDHLYVVPHLLENGSNEPTIFCTKTPAETLEKFCEDTGMNVSVCINMFVKEVLRHHKLPFEVATDPFYSKEHMEELEKRVADMRAGKNMHEHELIEAD